MQSLLFNKATSTTSLDSPIPESDSHLYSLKEILKSEESIPYNYSDLAANRSHSPPSFYSSYPHPPWMNWNAVWKQKPFEFDLDIIPPIQMETEFPNALFRLEPEFVYAKYGGPIIHQGATIVFTGFDISQFRHVVEWCEHIDPDNYLAYLRVVGYTSTGEPLPFNDLGYPNFILVVPANISTVPHNPVTLSILTTTRNTNFNPTSSSLLSGQKMKKFMFRIANGLKKHIMKYFKMRKG
jgi:hypothetical protein